MSDSVRILVVEDNPDQVYLLEETLKRHHPGWMISTAGDGPTCLDLLQAREFDVILLDFSLPRMNGLQILEAIRQYGMETPVVVVTGQGDEHVAVQVMKAGASDYVVKTQNYFTALPAVIERVMDQYRLKQELARSQSRLTRLYQLSLKLSTELRPDHLAQALVSGACDLTQSQCGLVAFLSQEGRRVEFLAVQGMELSEPLLHHPLEGKGLLGLSLGNTNPLILTDVQKDPRWAGTPIRHPMIRNALVIPMIRQDQVVGLLLVADRESGGDYTPGELDTLLNLVLHASSVLENARFVEETRQQAITDSLTGLFNHREFQRRLNEEVERSRRYLREFSLLMVDIDHFKSFNDSFGHPVGDVVLKEVGKIIKQALRQMDIPARYGGEEFSVILPETLEEGAEQVAERLRTAICGHSFATPGGDRAVLTVSIGVAMFPRDGSDREGILSASDQALYFAKEAGRNRVCLYSKTLKAAIERQPERMMEFFKKPSVQSARDLASAVDAKSPYTRGHSFEVARYALLMAEALDLADDQKESLCIASLLHNIGIVSVPDRIINKPGPLTLEERKIIQAHPGLAEMLLKQSPHLDQVMPAILYHHERWDGHGYPRGLQGEEIPYLARVLGMVEAYHAMISVRPYRRKLTHDEAVAEIRRNAGTQFDPNLAEAFIQTVKSQ
jgi:diguanylate cyclase (GGDEF)-like protein